jgi:hypothetical protein
MKHKNTRSIPWLICETKSNIANSLLKHHPSNFLTKVKHVRRTETLESFHVEVVNEIAEGLHVQLVKHS